MMGTVPPLSAFPTINATLNALTALLLVTGWLLIRRKRLAAHRACMLAAMATAALFLTSYLYYHAHAGSTRFPGTGWPRTLYLAILLTHTVLAAAVVPMALVTAWRGLKRRDARHRAIARWTFPIWLYVSITGVVVYWMLYRMSW
jgi:putative membrane protein